MGIGDHLGGYFGRQTLTTKGRYGTSVCTAFLIRGTCQDCGYPLAGLPWRPGGRVCPECGAGMSTERIAQAMVCLRGTDGIAAVRAMSFGYVLVLVGGGFGLAQTVSKQTLVTQGLVVTCIYLVACGVFGVVAGVEAADVRPRLAPLLPLRVGAIVLWCGTQWAVLAAVFVIGVFVL